MLIFWPEEINKHFALEPQNYTTPAFDGKHAANEFTSQEELMAFLKKMDAASGTMHLYSAGTTPNYKYDLPLALFTTSEIPANATLAEAAKIVKGNGKLNVWYQAQIHPNEPAAGEGALVMIDNFVNDPTYKALLDKINIVIVPRINPDGSYLFSRATYDGFDMNRDHMSLKAAELAQLHTAYRLFMSEVVLDTHEFTFYGAYNDDWTSAGEYMENADDLETTPATSLNNNPAVTKIGLDMAKRAFSDATNAGLRDTADVTFASGAYVFPMDQVASNVIAMLCEPDVTDSNGYDGTLYQYKQIDYDKSTMNFPLYRYTGTDPRTTLVSSGTSAEPTQPTQPTQPEKPSQPASSDTYTVVSGDSLWKIASKQLGNGNRWTEIYDLNKDTVKSPSVIFVGQILKMPLTAVSQ